MKYVSMALVIIVVFLTSYCGGGGSGTTSISDSTLSGIELSDVELDQIFQSSLTDYTASTKWLRSSLTVIPTTSDSNTTITVNGVTVNSGTASHPITLTEGDNTITITVTAADGTQTTYLVVVTRATVASFAQQAYLKASNAVTNYLFGTSVALDGDLLVVGSNGEDEGADNSGAVYVFGRDSSGVWSEQAYLKASNAGAGNYFGGSIDLKGDTLVVGAHGEGSYAGAVYVFTRDSSGAWSEQAYLKASNADVFNNFGSGVALNGNTLVVGSAGEDEGGDDVGAVYVFERDSSGAWSEQAYLKASNAGDNDYFGMDVALEGDTLVVGAFGEDNDAGAVYVFGRDGSGVWSQRAYLKASNADSDDLFGYSVDLDGDTLVAGAYTENGDANSTVISFNDLATDAGAVYVFGRDGSGVWSQRAYLKASNADADDRFGVSVDLNGNTLVVGSEGKDSNAGAAYVFTRDNSGTWSERAYLKASNADADDFFSLVALDGDTLVAGAFSEDGDANSTMEDPNNNAPNAGSVYVWQ